MSSQLYLSFLFSTIGIGYFMYGKRESEAGFILAGIALGVYPYFVSSVGMIVLLGVLVVAAPFVINRYWDF